MHHQIVSLSTISLEQRTLKSSQNPHKIGLRDRHQRSAAQQAGAKTGFVP